MIDVVVASYRRPELLARCLDALAAQTVQPGRVLVVLHDSDHESREVVEGAEVVTVSEPGVLAAMRAGVAATTAPLVAFTDDDATPEPDWLERLVDALADESVGAVGGRDVIPGQTSPLRSDVGRFRPSGKLLGNHHLGTGPARDVDVLKGVNMAFRAEALALPRAGVLRGDGAEVHYEVLVCRAVTRSGWRVVYDPAIRVGHLGAVRHGADQRRRPRPEAVRDAAHNLLVASCRLDPERRTRRVAYSLLLGSKDSPGLGRAVVAAARGEAEVLRRLGPSLSGSLLAIRRLTGRELDRPLVTCAELRAAAAVEVAA